MSDLKILSAVGRLEMTHGDAFAVLAILIVIFSAMFGAIPNANAQRDWKLRVEAIEWRNEIVACAQDEGQCKTDLQREVRQVVRHELPIGEELAAIERLRSSQTWNRHPFMGSDGWSPDFLKDLSKAERGTWVPNPLPPEPTFDPLGEPFESPVTNAAYLWVISSFGGYIIMSVLLLTGEKWKASLLFFEEPAKPWLKWPAVILYAPALLTVWCAQRARMAFHQPSGS